MGETRLERKAGVGNHGLFLEVKAHCDRPLEAGDRELWLVWSKPGVTGAWPTTPAGDAWGDRGAGFWGL